MLTRSIYTRGNKLWSTTIILRPLLFLLYVNDMSQSVGCDLLFYKDDSCLVFTGKNITFIEENLNRNV